LDPASGNFELVPCKTLSAQEAAEHLFHQYISRYGMPRKVISDRGLSFLSKLFTTLCKLGVNSSVAKTSSYRPSANSSAEVVNQTVIQFFRAYLKPQEDWIASLSTICMANRYLIKTSTHISPFQAMYGVPMKLDLDWQLLNDPEKLQSNHAVVHFYPQLTMLRKILQENLQGERDARDKRCNVNAKPHSFKVGDRVYLKVEFVTVGDKKHSRQFIGPYVILQLKGANLCRLQHLVTRKLLSHFTNVDKIRPLEDNTPFYANGCSHLIH
jgi:hypothetical protein